MDFLDPKKKRAHTIRLYIGYVLVGIALILATIILMFYAYGYGVDRTTGNVIQNGLIIVNAQPESATIKVNGAQRGTTSNRLVLPAGRYTVELSRQGYRPWTRTVQLAGSTIEQLVYPFLLPEQLVTKNLQTYDSLPSMASISPDRRWLVVHAPANSNSFQVIDLNNEDHPASTIALPLDAVTPTKLDQRYEAVEWSTDNQHLLLKRQFGDESEYILLDRSNPADSLNLNKVFGTKAMSGVSLRDKKANHFYFLNGPDRQLMVADSGTREVALVKTGVLAYKSYKNDTMLYVTALNDTQVSVILRQKDRDFAVRTLSMDTQYMLDIAEFDNAQYVVVGTNKDGRAYVYKNPFDALQAKPARNPEPFRVLVTQNIQHVSFSGNARFIAAQGGSTFAVYDAETNRQYRFDTKLTLTPGVKATWMDGHRLTLVSGGKVQVFDFDGANQQTLTESTDVFRPFFNRDYKALFTLRTDSNTAKAVLTRTELLVKNR